MLLYYVMLDLFNDCYCCIDLVVVWYCCCWCSIVVLWTIVLRGTLFE